MRGLFGGLLPAILLKTSLRHVRHHPWQVGLAILGVALGVAVVVSIDLSNGSARRAFSLSTEALTGRATHQIVGGPRGVDEGVYRRLRLELGVRDVAPLVEGYVVVPEHPGLTLHVLGMDALAEAPFRAYLPSDGASSAGDLVALFTQPGAALVSSTTAAVYGLQQGDGLQLRIGSQREEATLIGLLEPQDESSRRALDGLMIVDVATAQEWFDSVGFLSRIDLVLPDTPDGVALAGRVAAFLPPGTQLIRPAQRTQAIAQMTAAFELNLSALSMLALIVGMFLIYNTITFSVVQRRGLLGTLRCLGVTRYQVFALVLVEALVIGVVGSLAGLGLGIALGRGLVHLVTQTINDLYFAVSVRDIAISAVPLIKGFVLGVGATLGAAAVPALEATLTPPRTVLRRSSYEERVRRVVPWAAVVGMGLLVVGVGVLAIPSTSLVLSFGALFAMTLGAAALTPMVTLVLMRVAHPVLGRMLGLLGRMAARDVVATLSRTSVAIAALMIAVSVTIGVGLMVGSFRQTVVRWLDASLRADIYVSVHTRLADNRLDLTLPPGLVERFQVAPGVARARRYRSVTVESPVGPTQVVALEVPQAEDAATFQLVEGVAAQTWAGFAAGEVLVSEPLAFHRGLHVGDSVALLTDQGERVFRVAGVFYDYGSDQGVVMMSLATYRADWDDDTVSSLGLYVAPGVDVDSVVQQLRDSIDGDEAINVRSNRALRDASLAIFDRTFAITTVLQVLATVVAFVGILSALMALQLERARELGMLRANGLTPRQVWGVVISQTGLIGLTAGLLALPVGVMLAAVLVFVINKRSFGWTLFFQLDGGLFAQAVAMAVLAAVLAGLYPAWRMSRTSPARALREE